MPQEKMHLESKVVRTRGPSPKIAAAALALQAAVASGCAEIIGIEPWEDPDPTTSSSTGETTSTGGTGGSGGMTATGTGGTGGGPECELPKDCPAPDTDCKVATCEDGVCRVENKPKGDVCSENDGLVCDEAGMCHCNPTAPDSITLLNTGNNVGKKIEMVQFENGGATINQAGSTQDAEPSALLPACMENVQPGSFPVIVTECMPNCLVDVTHTSEFTQPSGATYHCYDGSAFTNAMNPTQAELKVLFLDDPSGSLAYAGQNPWVLGAACSSGQFAYYKLSAE